MPNILTLPDTVWRCHAAHKAEGSAKVKRPPQLFIVEDGRFHQCPHCGSEDVFPYRLFKCTNCGHEASQEDFFPDSDGDIHPFEDGDDRALCPECCYEDEEMIKVIQIPVVLPAPA